MITCQSAGEVSACHHIHTHSSTVQSGIRW